MINIKKDELDEIYIELTKNVKWRSSELLLLYCIIFEHLFAIVRLLLLLKQFLLMLPDNTH